MPAATSTREAIKKWEANNPDKPVAEAEHVALYCQLPPMDKMGEELNQFESCIKMSLSTNAIERMTALPKLKNIKILSLARNNIKRIMALDEIGQSLEELWLSYNQIDKIDGLQNCVKLTTFFLGNNRVRSWDELNKVAMLPEIKNVLFQGNIIWSSLGKDDKDNFIPMVVKRIPQADTIDGKQVLQEHRDAAEAMD